MSVKEEVYHLSPLGVLGTDEHDKLQRYMLLLKEVWGLGTEATVAVVLERGRLQFRELELPGRSGAAVEKAAPHRQKTTKKTKRTK